MKTLILSDIHDHLPNLEMALNAAQTAGCSSMICCGDLCSPFVLDMIHERWPGPVHIVFGNNDGDRFAMANKAANLNRFRSPEAVIVLHGEYLLSPAGEHLPGIPDHISVAAYHFPPLARIIAESGLYKCVFYGHSHIPDLQKVGDCLLANPGSVMGFVPGNGSDTNNPTCLIINWENGETDLINLH